MPPVGTEFYTSVAKTRTEHAVSGRDIAASLCGVMKCHLVEWVLHVGQTTRQAVCPEYDKLLKL